MILCMVTACVDCVCTATVVGWHGLGILGHSVLGHIGGMAGSEVSAGWGSPRALCIECTLVGQLKLKWVQAGMSQGAPCRGHPGGAAGAEAGVGYWVLCSGCPGKLSGAKVVQAWSVPGCFSPVSSCQDGWNCSETD